MLSLNGGASSVGFLIFNLNLLLYALNLSSIESAEPQKCSNEKETSGSIKPQIIGL